MVLDIIVIYMDYSFCPLENSILSVQVTTGSYNDTASVGFSSGVRICTSVHGPCNLYSGWGSALRKQAAALISSSALEGDYAA